MKKINNLIYFDLLKKYIINLNIYIFSKLKEKINAFNFFKYLSGLYKLFNKGRKS
jgi:hypothetical protein